MQHLRQRRTLRELTLIVYSASRCSIWPLYHALAMQMQCTNGKYPSDPEKNKSKRESGVGERGKVHLEAGDALLALPIAFATTMFFISLFLQIVGSRGSVNNNAHSSIWHAKVARLLILC